MNHLFIGGSHSTNFDFEMQKVFPGTSYHLVLIFHGNQAPSLSDNEKFTIQVDNFEFRGHLHIEGISKKGSDFSIKGTCKDLQYVQGKWDGML